MLASALALLFALTTGAAQPGSFPDPAHRVSIRVAGPVALVEVEREVMVAAGSPARDTLLELDLPEGAAVVDRWETRSAGRVPVILARAEPTARAEYARVLSAHKLSPAPVPRDDAVRIRVHLAPLAASGRVLLRYRYSAPTLCIDGRFVVRVPASLEDNPTAAAVAVTFDDLPADVRLADATVAGVPVRISSRGRASVFHTTAPARTAWEVSFTLREQGWPGQVLAAREGRPNQGSSQAAAVLAVCRPRRRASEPAPGEVLLLLDRSRSVGSGGMSSERALARAVLEALPPAQRFNAVLFGKTVASVFPLARTATREALDAFETAADPNRLDNGTDLTAALRSAAAWAKGDGAGVSRLLVIISDGALPESQTAEMLVGALAPVAPGAGLRVLALLLRPAADDPVPADAVERFGRLVGHFGGVVRVLSAEDLRGVARSSLVALAQGGDLLELRSDGRRGQTLAAGVAPGDGFVKVSTLGQGSRVRLAAEYAGTTVRAQASAVSVASEWLAPLVAVQPPRTWAGSLPEAAFLVETVVAGPPPSSDGVDRGQMDPLVLRNALALAFLPRARACYLSRRVANGADLALHGRVRLELHLQRGELEDAIIRRSSLNRPDIERCVQQAAFDVEYPRPMFRDAPTVAAVNLVFRPRTPEETRPDASSFDRQIDLILGPVIFDPKKLLESEIPESGAADKTQSD